MRTGLRAIASILWASGVFVWADTAIEPRPEGGFRVVSDHYAAVIGADGNLRSLTSAGTEFLLDGYRGLVGGGYLNIKEGPTWSAEAFTFDRVERSETNCIAASADAHMLTYRFLPDAIELVFSHTKEPTIWHLVLNPTLTNIVEKRSGEVIPRKTAWREGMPQVFSAGGANVTLPDGALYYIAKNAHQKPDADPDVLQVWMPRTWSTATITNRLVVHARPTTADALRATLGVSPGNHLLSGGQPAAIGLAGNLRFPGLPLKAEVELSSVDFLTRREVFNAKQAFSLPALGQGNVTFAVTPPPGFYEAVMTVKQDGETLVTRRFFYAYDLDQMPPPERPADFDTFWDDTLAEQDRTPADPQLSLSREDADTRLYKVSFNGLLGRRFHAWLSIPVKEGKFPAHLILPPSGINKPYLPYASSGVVGMSLAIAGQDVEPPEGGYAAWDYFRSGIEKRETWYYRAVYAACSRAVDLLAARPEVDPARIFVTGGSQGGGLAFITAGLNPKVGMAVCSSPGLFGLEWKLRHLSRHAWPPIDPVDAQGQPVTDPQALEDRVAVARYGEAASFAPRIRGAVLLNIGLQDHVTSPAGAIAAWAQIRNARIKALLADPWGGHNGPRGGQGLSSAWFQALVEDQIDRVLGIREAGGLPVIVSGAAPSQGR